MLKVLPLHSQEFQATLTTELETDFHDKTDWVNQLRLDFSMPISQQLHFDVTTLSVGQSREAGVSGDYQTFSNIYADNMALALAVAGLRWEMGKSMFFAGVRNVNEDYFDSPVTSLFTNSSCGIYPTISMNAPLANYPFSAVGIHYSYDSENWIFKASVYNGAGHNKFSGSDNVFRVCPKSDGIFGIASLNYNQKGSQYFIGGSYYNGKVAPGIPDGVEPKAKGRYTNVALLGFAEQRLTPTVKLMLQCSGSPTNDAECYSYFGAGLTKEINKVQCGLFSDYAHFAYGKEWATEATAKVQLNEKCHLQPALHFIRTDGKTAFVGLFRMGYEL